jgi:hypothetical protein
MPSVDPPPAELLARAQEDVIAVVLATVGYCRARDLAVADWAGYVGVRVAPLWEELRGQGALALAREAARHLAAGGLGPASVVGDAARAAVTVAWPPEEALAFFEVGADETADVLTVFAPIAAALGLICQVRSERGALRLIFAADAA